MNELDTYLTIQLECPHCEGSTIDALETEVDNELMRVHCQWCDHEWLERDMRKAGAS